MWEILEGHLHQHENFEDLCLSILDNLGKICNDSVEFVPSMNERFWDAKTVSAGQVTRRAMVFLNDWDRARHILNTPPAVQQPMHEESWHPPPWFLEM